MKKSLTFILSAAFVAMSVQAAPLAKRTVGKGMSPELTQEASTDFKRPEILKFRDLQAGQTPLLHEVKSVAAAKRAQAAMSAKAAQRAVTPGVQLVAQAGANSFNLQQRRFYNLPLTDATDATAFTVYQDVKTTPIALLNSGGYYDESDKTFRGVFHNHQQQYYLQATYYELYLETGMWNQMTQYSLSSDNYDLLAYCVAKDPITDVVYAATRTADGAPAQWATIDYRSKQVNTIKQLNFNIDEDYYIVVDGAELLYLMGTTKEGQFYGIRWDGNLVKIEKTTGQQTVIGQTGLSYQYDGAACINDKDGVMMVALTDGQTSTTLYEVNLATATTSVVATYPMVQFFNMFMVPYFEQKAPAAPELVVEAADGTMTASYKITLPSTLYDGTPLTGAVEWEIKANGEVIADGKNMAGSAVDGEYTFTTSGLVNFTAVAKNVEGESPMAKARLYVGKGIPGVPANIKAFYADGKMNITWDAVTESADGGFFEADKVTYDVLDGGMILARGISANEFSFAFSYPESLHNYQYAVVANYDGKKSGMGLSNLMKLGAVELPYLVEFSGESSIDDANLTILDANDDGNTWYVYTSCDPMPMRVDYNRYQAMDDWAFTPEFRLEAGKMYEFKIMTWGQSSSYPERVEVKMGWGTTPEAMTTQVIEPTVVGWSLSDRQYLTAKVIPTATGNYNFGIHGCSDKDMYNLNVSEIYVSKGYAAAAPVAPTDMVLTPEATGMNRCTVAVTAPTVNVMDGALEGDLTINVSRNGTLVQTLTAAPGATVTFTDDVPDMGDYTYSAVAVNADGEDGPAITKTAYVGPFALVKSTRCEFFETNQPGTVTVIWDAVTKDVKGNYVSPGQVSYMVYDAITMKEMLPERTTKLRATFQAVDPDTQDFRQFAVAAFNRELQPSYNDFALTNYAPVGKPYDLPVVYTDDESVANYVLSVSDVRFESDAMMYGDDYFNDISSADKDGFFFGFKHPYTNGVAAINTGKINLLSELRPELSFYVAKLANDDTSQLEVIVIADDAQKTIATITNDQFDSNGWHKVRLSLADYKGKNVQLKFRSTSKGKMYHFIDNIQVKETPEVDMQIVGVSAPKNVKAGMAFDINVEITNLGWKTADGYSVNLYRDGEVVDTRDMGALESDETAYVIFDNVISYFDENNTEAVYNVEVVCDGDADMTNNVWGDVVVNRPASELPTVNDLAAEATEDGIKLTWSDPVGGGAKKVSEDFESYEAADTEFGEWTIIDRDGLGVWGVGDEEYTVPIPGLDPEEPMGWTIFDSSLFDPAIYGDWFAAASGTKYMFVSASIGGQNDDWAISPVLSGNEQTISFYAKSYGAPDFYETIVVYASKVDSTDPADFEAVATFKDMSGDWTNYDVNLEEGTVRFAIVCESNDQLFCFVDDIKYEVADASDLTIDGYDVYRNGVKIGETNGDSEYVDSEAGFGKHIYHVVARYADGDSELSNPAMIEVAGIMDVAAKAQASVKVDGRDIVISNAAGHAVAISTIDGKLLFTANGDARYTVAPAFYMVTVNGRAYKVAVR